jgi:hypothetical protein
VIVNDFVPEDFRCHGKPVSFVWMRRVVEMKRFKRRLGKERWNTDTQKSRVSVHGELFIVLRKR